MKSIPIVLLVLLLTAPVFAGGKKEVPTDYLTKMSQPGEVPLTTEPVYMTAFLARVGDVLTVDPKVNLFSKWMQEQTNVHFTYEEVPEQESREKLNLILASADLPDVFILSRRSMTPVMQYTYGSKQGLLMLLDDLIEKYGHYTKEIFKKYPLAEMMARIGDGKIYSLPTWEGLAHVQVAQRMWGNKEWLKKLGFERPETTEEFYEVLKAIKNRDPNGNGKQDEIPLLGGAKVGGGWHGSVDGFFTGSFIYWDGQYMDHVMVKDGKVVSIIIQPEYREALRYLNRLWSEGLIYEGSYSIQVEQMKGLLEHPDGPMIGYYTNGNAGGFFIEGGERVRQYDSMPVLRGPKGVRLSMWDPFYQVQTAKLSISSTCKYPEIAFRWADYCYSRDASMRIRMGAKGRNWRDPLPGETDMQGKPSLFTSIKAAAGTRADWRWANIGVFQEPAEVQFGQTIDPNTSIYDAQNFRMLWEAPGKKMWQWIPPIKMLVPQPLATFSPEEFEFLGIAKVEVMNYFEQNKVKFITGERDINNDADWNRYVADLNKVGLPKMIDYYNNAYKRFVDINGSNIQTPKYKFKSPETTQFGLAYEGQETVIGSME